MLRHGQSTQQAVCESVQQMLAAGLTLSPMPRSTKQAGMPDWPKKEKSSPAMVGSYPGDTLLLPTSLSTDMLSRDWSSSDLCRLQDWMAWVTTSWVLATSAGQTLSRLPAA